MLGGIDKLVINYRNSVKENEKEKYPYVNYLMNLLIQ